MTSTMVRSPDMGNDGMADDCERMRALHDQARARHPNITVDLDEFIDYLLARTAADTPLEVLHPEDLYLACGGARGAGPAIAVLDQRVVAAARAATARHR